MDYQNALDLIFRSFIAAKPFLQGKYDREVRNPELLLGVARKLNLLPDPARVLKVTGSKGKGTVARLCAHSLQKKGRVGLVVSPEEIDHVDRMSINGSVISKERFTTCFEKIWQAVSEPCPPQYLSPYGLFLLTALQWFSEEGIDYYVIETGRGVRFDEGGQLTAKVGVVTSIFLEHAGYLGPTLEDIRSDKLSIKESCEITIIACDDTYPATNRPNWYVKSQHLAARALEAFLGESVGLPDGPCASFGTDGQSLFYEGLIAPESADVGFLSGLVERYGDDLCFFVSLPDDKDIAGVMAVLDGLNARVKQVVLTGERGVLSYKQAKAFDVAYEGPYNDPVAFAAGLDKDGAKVAYFIGTQTFLRLVKQAFFK